MIGNSREQLLNEDEGVPSLCRIRREEPVEEVIRIHGRATGDRLGQMGQTDENKQDERDGRQERVERERARQKGDVTLVSGLQGAA